MTRAIVAISILASALVGATALTSRPNDGALPYYSDKDFTPRWAVSPHHVGAFSLTTQTGASITDRDLAGKLHVASFIYTRCGAICPTIVANLRRVQSAIDDPRVVLLSYSVTPELDTPAVLAAYGRTNRIDPARWKLVTGDKSQIYGLARDSYFADDDRLKSTLNTDDAFLHTEKVLLVDGTGRIRGVYNATQPFDMEKLIADIKTLLPAL